jgi:hypothetical protein
MNAKQIELISTQAQIILEEAKNLRGNNLKIRNLSSVEYVYYLRTIDKLISQLNFIEPKINKLFKKEGVDFQIKKYKKFNVSFEEIRDKKMLFGAEPKLLSLIFEASNILSFINSGIALPEVTQNKLESIDEEIFNLKTEINSDLLENLKDAKNCFERGCFLGSSLISGRVIRTLMDKIKGKDINEKIDTLKSFDLIRAKDGKASLLKANHYGRNLASHDLSIMPIASEAISYLGEALKLSKIINKYIKDKEVVQKDEFSEKIFSPNE